MTNKQFLIGIILSIALIFGLHLHGWAGEPKQISQGAYSQARSVRICAIAGGRVYKCGTGVFYKNNKIITAFHVVSNVEVEIDGMPPQMLKTNLVFLRESETRFEAAVLTSSFSSIDIAILTVGGTSPQAILQDEFYRGEKVWSVGNPEGRDFQVVETKIVGVTLFDLGGARGLTELIMVDAKENTIRPGYSGGGLFTERGLVGIVQMCDTENSTCLAMPTRVIRDELKEALK